MWGGDGLVSQFIPVDESKSICRLYVSTARAYINLPRNLQMQQSAWGMPPEGQWHDYSKGSATYFGQWPYHGLQPPHGNPAASVLAHFDRAASVVQYAAVSYYHWVLETLGRLIVLLDSGMFAATAEAATILLLPKDISSNEFVQQYLDILRRRYPDLHRLLQRDVTGVDLRERLVSCYQALGKPDKIGGVDELLSKYAGKENVLRAKLRKKYTSVPQCHIPSNAMHTSPNPGHGVFYYDTSTYPNDVRVTVAELFYPSWDSVDMVVAENLAGPFTDVDQAASDSLHALMPKQGIVLVRDRLLSALTLSSPSRSQPYVLFLTRATESMRRLEDEAAIIAQLKGRVGEQNVVVFDGSKFSIEETAQLFHFAAVIVGVHGGALSNIVFCKPPSQQGHTNLVLEFGYPAPQARHYAHAAAALGLHYENQLLAFDSRGPGSPEVRTYEIFVFSHGVI